MSRGLGDVYKRQLFSQVWSFTDDGDETEVSLFTWQPFVNYNLPRGAR